MTPNAFTALLDDAAVFPPGNAPLPQAVQAHLARRGTPDGVLVGPLVLTPDRLADLAGILGEPEVPLSLSLVVRDLDAVDDVLARVAADGRLRLAALEIAAGPELLPQVPGRTAGLEGVDVWVEPGWGPHLPAAVALLHEAGLGLKLRTGGTTAEAFPTEQVLADAVALAVGDGVRFKATAGLHHAVRHTDPLTGFEHHGFANLLLASHAAGTRAALDWLACRDGEQVAAALRDLGPAGVAEVRRTRFGSFGTCDVEGPRLDLDRMGLLTPAEVTA